MDGLPDWPELTIRTREAADALPPLPAWEQVRREGDWLRELGYTFWNRELLDSLAARLRLLAVPAWLELAAGTGCWAAELARRGLPAAATDDCSQAPERVTGSRRAVRYGSWVALSGAREAVAAYVPEGVLLSWPPLGSCLVPELLTGALPGSEALRAVVCIGEPDGATEAPVHPGELPPRWRLEQWPECERWLIAFNDPPPGPGWRSHARLLIYLREAE